MAKTQLFYPPVRGRGEVIRLALHHAGVEYEELSVDRAQMKTNLDAFPFGQVPRLVDGENDIVQSHVILRYIARKHGLLGSTEKEQYTTEIVMAGEEALRSVYTDLIYRDQLSEEAQAKYAHLHLDKATTGERNNGAHLAFLARFVERSATGYVAGTPSPTIGDLCFWELLDIHLRIPAFNSKIAEQYPHLIAFHKKVSELPSIKAYLPKRLEKVNANNLG